MTEQELREKIDEFIWTILSFGRECSDEWVANQKSSGRPFVNHRRKYLFDLIKQANYVRLADDQSLPVLRASPYPKPEHWDDVALENYISRQTQQDMQDAGFRKVEL